MHGSKFIKILIARPVCLHWENAEWKLLRKIFARRRKKCFTWKRKIYPMVFIYDMYLIIYCIKYKIYNYYDFYFFFQKNRQEFFRWPNVFRLASIWRYFPKSTQKRFFFKLGLLLCMQEDSPSRMHLSFSRYFIGSHHHMG